MLDHTVNSSLLLELNKNAILAWPISGSKINIMVSADCPKSQSLIASRTEAKSN